MRIANLESTLFIFFLSRVSIAMHAERDTVMAYPSVCPSVRHTLVLYRNNVQWPIAKIFPPSGRGVNSVFECHYRYTISRVSLSAGALNTINGGRNNLRFSTEIAVYLENGTRWPKVTMKHY